MLDFVIWLPSPILETVLEHLTKLLPNPQVTSQLKWIASLKKHHNQSMIYLFKIVVVDLKSPFAVGDGVSSFLS